MWAAGWAAGTSQVRDSWRGSRPSAPAEAYNERRVSAAAGLSARTFFKENTMTENTEGARERLVDDFANVLGEAEEMLTRAAAETGDKARDLRSQVETKLLRAKLRLQEIEGEAVDRAKAAARATDDYVHEHPWHAIGVAAAIGVAIGLLLNRRS
jgi:ElaB/YqjD/DUF883 family membrane-anchored ribosome-binding protein